MKFLTVILLCSTLGLSQAARQPLPDEKGIVADAEKKLAADPGNVELLLALGKAQADVWRFEDAIATYTRGLKVDPKKTDLLLNRGHRYVTLRKFDLALKDLEAAAKIDANLSEVWYHIGLVHFFRGNFDKALPAWQRTRDLAKTDDNLASSSDWLYMTLRRLKKDKEAAEVLTRITPDMKITGSPFYHRRLLFYKGLKKEDELIDKEKDTNLDLAMATVGYGIGNWYLCNGNEAKAREYFERIVTGKYWPAFGFIAAENDLARMKSAKK